MNIITLVILFFVVVAGSIIADIYSCNELYTIFQRSGSLVVLLGVIFESKFILRLNENNTLYIDGELSIYELKSNEKPKVKFFSAETLNRHLGYYAILVGTVIWGYGDLLGKLFI